METSQLICTTNQLTGFYMRTTLARNGVSLKESTYETRKKCFLFHFKNSFCSRENQFWILDIQISWRSKSIKPKHKTRNTFHWKTWEVNAVCLWNLTSLYHITKKIIFSKNSAKTATWKLVPDHPFCVCKELSTTSIGKWNFYSKLLILDK